MKKMKCRTCFYLNYDFFTYSYACPNHHFCGLHGRCKVDPDGPQMDLDHRGGCGYLAKKTTVQLEIEW